MSIRIGSNIPALSAQRALSNATDELSRTTERLSSGLRINSASDDAAGLAIATSLNADSRIFSQAIRNANDGISLLNIAEGSLSQLSSITDRLRELTFQSANGTYSTQQRRSLGIESDQLVDEFNRLVSSSRFNGLNLLDGSQRELALQIGSGNGSILRTGIGGSLGRFSGTGQIASHTNITSANGTGDYSHAVDLNNDGKLDLVHGSTSGTNSFVVQIGNGDGTFGAEVSYDGFFSPHLRVSDFNNDGNIDIAGVGNGSGEVIVMYGVGDGTFASKATFHAGLGNINLRSFELADLNGDGIEDIVNFNSTGGGYSVMLGNADGSFNRGTSFSLSGIDGNSSFALGDLNNDGRIDLVYSTSDASGSVVTLFGNGNGTFGGAVTRSTGTGRATGVSLGDLNRDGFLDIVTLNNGTNSTRVLTGNGDGTFRAVRSFNTTNSFNSLTLADLNNDGILDLFTGVFGSGVIETAIGNGDGTFASARSYASGTGSVFRGLAADIDNDGSVELIFGRNGTSTLILYQNENYSSNLEYLNLSTQASALSSLRYLENATLRIQKELGSVGAHMSRLGIATGNLLIAREQYRAAESRIRDADIGFESAQAVAKGIVQKTAAAILAQATQQPKIAIQLLQNA